MRDPHVVSLRYRLETAEHASYRNPPPLEHETGGFSFHLADDVLTLRMKQHHSSIESACAEVEEFLRAWELDVALALGPGELRFVYEDGVVIDRDPPPPGTPQVVQLSGVSVSVSAGSATIHVARTKYPAPPEHFRVSPDVETLWQRYIGYRDGREPLLSMAYFCLSLVEARAVGRKHAARQLAIDEEVLRKLGELTSTRGDGITARKFNRQGALQPMTGAESVWIEAAVKSIIRRLAEADPTNARPWLGMSELPPV